MAKMEEYRPPTKATNEEKILVDKLYSVVGHPLLSDWDNTFISSMKARKDDQFVLLISDLQRKILIKIWEKLYDTGIIT